MNKIVITSDEDKVYIKLNDFASEFSNTIELTVHKNNIVQLELVRNTDTGDYIEYELANGKEVQLMGQYVESVNETGDITDSAMLYELLKAIM